MNIDPNNSSLVHHGQITISKNEDKTFQITPTLDIDFSGCTQETFIRLLCNSQSLIVKIQNHIRAKMNKPDFNRDDYTHITIKAFDMLEVAKMSKPDRIAKQVNKSDLSESQTLDLIKKLQADLDAKNPDFTS